MGTALFAAFAFISACSDDNNNNPLPDSPAAKDAPSADAPASGLDAPANSIDAGTNSTADAGASA